MYKFKELRRELENNIWIDLAERGCEDRRRSEVNECCVQWRVLLTIALNFKLPTEC
jgi:hypothetical protein